MQLPDTLDKFTCWLIEQPFITSDSWKANADSGIWLLDAVCTFEPDKHSHKKDTGYRNRWDADYHNHCPMAIGVSIESGGVSGGSCWDDSNPTGYSCNYTLPDLTSRVIEIIGEFFPDVTLVKYTKHCTNLVRKGEHTAYEYYGNCTAYKSLYVTVESLYKSLKALEN